MANVNSLALLIAKRFRQGKRRSGIVSVVSFISTMSIALGVAVLLIGLSAMNGFERELHQRVLSVIPHGEVFDPRGPMANWRDVESQLLEQTDVVSTEPYVSFTGLIEYKTTLKALQIKGVDLAKSAQSSQLARFFEGESLADIASGQQKIVLGQGVATHLGVSIGDWVTVMMASQNQQNQIALQQPKRIRLQVAGILALSGDLGNQFALVPLQDAQQYTSLGDSVTGVMVTVKDLFKARYTIYRAVGQLRENLNARTWESDYGYMYRDIQLIRSIMYMSMVLVIGVACFNIISTLMIAVKDKRTDIAVLRTLGANDRLIRGIFIWYGLLTGIVGSLIGLILGVSCALNLSKIMALIENVTGHHFLSSNVYFIDFIPSQLQLGDVIAVLITSLILSLLASWYPARRASKIEPARVLSGL